MSEEEIESKQAEETGVERLQPEKAEERQIQPGQRVRALATYSATENRVLYKVIPQFTEIGARFVLWVFLEGSQGPLLRTSTGITEEQADRLGLSRELQLKINTLLSEANRYLKIPEEFRGMRAEKRGIDDLDEAIEHAKAKGLSG